MDSSNSEDIPELQEIDTVKSSKEIKSETKSGVQQYFEAYCKELKGYFLTITKIGSALYQFYNSVPLPLQVIIGLLIGFSIIAAIHFSQHPFSAKDLIDFSCKTSVSMAFLFSLLLNKKPLVQSIFIAISILNDGQISKFTMCNGCEQIFIIISILLIGINVSILSRPVIKTILLAIAFLLNVIVTIVSLVYESKIVLYSHLIVLTFRILLYITKQTKRPLEHFHLLKFYQIQKKLVPLFSFTTTYILIVLITIAFSPEPNMTRFDNFISNLLETHNFAPLFGYIVAFLITGNYRIKEWFVGALLAFAVIRTSNEQYLNTLLDIKLLCINGYVMTCIDKSIKSFLSSTIILVASLVPNDSIYNLFQV